MFSTADFRKGLKIELEGKPFVIVEFLHVKPGKGGAFVRTKIKNMDTGQVLEKTFRAGEKVAKPDLEEKNMQFLYKEHDQFCMMDNETYEQIFISVEQAGDAALYMKENVNVDVLLFKGNPISVELPNFVELRVSETDPGVRGDTASGGAKPATLETGAVVQVPLFLEEGELVKVDTRSGQYIERVKS